MTIAGLVAVAYLVGSVSVSLTTIYEQRLGYPNASLGASETITESGSKYLGYPMLCGRNQCHE
jgi:hypothetical protein